MPTKPRTRPSSPADILAHKRKLKAAQMARYRADRKVVHLTIRERTLMWQALSLLLPKSEPLVQAEIQRIAEKIKS